MTASTRFSIPSFSFFLALPLTLLFAITVQAQSSTSTSASIYPAPTGWTYNGCYNETTLTNGTEGTRALSGGTLLDTDTMTVPICLAYCKSNSFTFAGLEYTRECYCAQYISALSTKVSDSDCNLACIGNSTEICGGALKLSVYQTKTSTKGAAVPVQPVGSILALGIAIGVLLCLT